MLARKHVVFQEIHQKLYDAFGPQHWWPGETQIEIIVGAILTQNTNWKNVEKALVNLKREKLLSSKALFQLSNAKLARLIRPAGHFNIKTKRLKNFLLFLFSEYGGSLRRMEKEDGKTLREKLLLVNGIGPETADSILLYAFNKPFFVIDTYTKRFLSRHHIIESNVDYHSLQNIFTANSTRSVKMYNEYHALIVNLGKDFCKTNPLCDSCPLNYLNKRKRYAYVP